MEKLKGTERLEAEGQLTMKMEERLVRTRHNGGIHALSQNPKKYAVLTVRLTEKGRRTADAIRSRKHESYLTH